MSKSVLELAVGTGQWNAGLKKAKSALDNFTQSQGGLQQALAKDSDSMQKFVRMMGGMESTAKTAKGQMNDYKSTIEQLTMQYNRMSEAQKKTIGQDYLQAIEQMKQKYQSVNEEIQEMNRSLNNVKLPDMKDAGGGLFSGLGDKMSGALQVFAGNMLTKAAGAMASLGSEMVDMVQQGVELAKQGEGIRIAFERLGRGDILDGLREATHGTVTDLELMKAAVKFNDFKLPIEELGTMLAFAQQKAKDTGQSVDYMVDSIVTGLGRKSLMILDNLGLSATEVKEKMAETGDMTKAVGAIIREQMSKAGDYVETAADRAAQANVSLQNKMEELGRKFVPLEEACNNFWTSMKIGILDVVGGPLTNLLNKLTEAGRLMNAYGQMGGSGKVGRFTAYLASASEGKRQNIYQQQQANFWKYINPREQQIKDIRAWQSGERNEALQKRIGAITEKYGSLDATKIQAEVDAAKKMLSEYQQEAKQILSPVKVDIDTKGANQNVESLKVKLIKLEAQRKKAIAAGDTDLSKNLAKQISQVKSDIKGLGGTTTTTTKAEVKAVSGSIDEQTKKVQELQKAWRAAADDDSRQKIKAEIEEQQYLLDRMTGKENFDPKKIQALTDLRGKQLTLTVTADVKDALEKVRAIEGVTIDDKAFTVTVKADDEKAAEKLRNLGAVEIGDKAFSVKANAGDTLEKVRAIEGVTIDDKTFDVTAETAEALRKLREIDGFKISPKTVEVTQESRPDFSSDMKRGKDMKWYDATAPVAPSEIKFSDGLQKLMDYMEKLQVDDYKKRQSRDGWDDTKKVVSGLGQVASGLQQMGVKLPEEVQQVLGVINGLMMVIEGVNTIIGVTQTTALSANTAAMVALTSALYANTAVSAVPFFAHGGVVKAAMGYEVPGNHYSGDMVPALLNSGETVLNRAQSGILASALEGAGNGFKNGQIVGRIEGEKIVLVANRYFKRSGQGEIVTW